MFGQRKRRRYPTRTGETVEVQVMMSGVLEIVYATDINDLGVGLRLRNGVAPDAGPGEDLEMVVTLPQQRPVFIRGVLRLMAYNTGQILRRRRLRKKDPDGTAAPLMTWWSHFKAIEKSLELDAQALCTG